MDGGLCLIVVVPASQIPNNSKVEQKEYPTSE
jgi:hypothetical protein